MSDKLCQIKKLVEGKIIYPQFVLRYTKSHTKILNSDRYGNKLLSTTFLKNIINIDLES